MNHLDTIFSPGIYLDRDKKAFAFIKDRLLHQESCAIVGMYGNGKDYLFTNLVKEFEGMKLPYQIKILNTISADELKNFADMLDQETQPTLCMVNIRIRKDVSWFIQTLEQLRLKRGYSFVSFISSYVGDVYQALKNMESPITSSLVILELISYEDALHIIDEHANRFGFFPTEEQKKDIYHWTYGHVGLLRTLFLLKREHPDVKFSSTFLLREPSFLERLTNIITDLPEGKIQSLLKKKTGLIDTMFFERFGYITKEGKLFHPLLKMLIPKQTKEESTSLSRTETAVLEYFQKHSGQLVSREDIGKIVWGEEEWEDKYSDWAIGQLIYRLRLKLEYGSSGIIQTQKGKGFLYTPLTSQKKAPLFSE